MNARQESQLAGIIIKTEALARTVNDLEERRKLNRARDFLFGILHPNIVRPGAEDELEPWDE